MNKEVLVQLTRLDLLMDEAEGDMLHELEAECDRLELNVESTSEQIEVFEQDGLYGLKQKSVSGISEGKVLFPAVYESITSPDDDESLLIGRKGRMLTILYHEGIRVDKTIECDDIVSAGMNFWYVVRNRSKWGLYSMTGEEWILPVEYDWLQIKSGHIVINRDGKYGLVTGPGEIVPAEYDSIRFCRHAGYVGFYKDGQLGYINADGKWTTDINEASLWVQNYDELW